MLNCHVVRDLLPGYIDGLSSAETNAEISEHLQGCEDCRLACERMKAPLAAKPEAALETETEKKSVNFLKRTKKKAWRNAAIAVGAALALCAVFAWAFIWGWRVSGDDLICDMSAIILRGPEGHTLPEEAIWMVDLRLGNDRQALFVSSEQEFEYDEDGNIVAETLILTPRATWALINQGRQVGYAMSENNNGYHTEIVIRLAEGDVSASYTVNEQLAFAEGYVITYTIGENSAVTEDEILWYTAPDDEKP